LPLRLAGSRQRKAASDENATAMMSRAPSKAASLYAVSSSGRRAMKIVPVMSSTLVHIRFGGRADAPLRLGGLMPRYYSAGSAYPTQRIPPSPRLINYTEKCA
jgi:hypothetical protein